jgi:hypothetical protein
MHGYENVQRGIYECMRIKWSLSLSLLRVVVFRVPLVQIEFFE